MTSDEILMTVAAECLHGRAVPHTLAVLWKAHLNEDVFISDVLAWTFLQSLEVLDEGYSNAIAEGNADILANVGAHQKMFERLGFFARMDDGELLAFDFESGDQDDPPVVVLDTEGQYRWQGINLAEALQRSVRDDDLAVTAECLEAHAIPAGDFFEIGASTQFLPSIQDMQEELYYELLGQPRPKLPGSDRPADVHNPATWLLRPANEVQKALNTLLGVAPKTIPSRSWVQCDADGRIKTIWFYKTKETESVGIYSVKFGMSPDQVNAILGAPSKKGDGWMSFLMIIGRLWVGFENGSVNQMCLMQDIK